MEVVEFGVPPQKTHAERGERAACGFTGVGWPVSLWIWSYVSLVGRSVSGGTWLSVLY